MTALVVRRYREEDAPGAAQVFFDAVHVGTEGVYDGAQRRAWGGDSPDPAKWRARLQPLSAFVAERDGEILGFMTIDRDGLIDFAFVAPAVAGTGVGWRLYLAVEQEARALGASILRTEASLAARSFFARQGWEVVARQEVSLRGTTLTNFKMRKALAGG